MKKGRILGRLLAACIAALAGLPIAAEAVDDSATAAASSSIIEESPVSDSEENLLMDGLPWLVYIGTNDYPPENIPASRTASANIATFNLDAPRNLERQLSDGLPNDSIEEAQRIADTRFDALGEERVRAVFRPVAMVMQWDIRKVPAIVFDNGKYVIYGLTDLGEALEVWRKWHRSGGRRR